VEQLDLDPSLIVFVIKSDRFCLSKAFGLFENKLKANEKIESYQIK